MNHPDFVRSNTLTWSLNIVIDQLSLFSANEFETFCSLYKSVVEAKTAEEYAAASAAVAKLLGETDARVTAAVSARIKELRDKAGLTQAELAAKSGLHKIRIQWLESGEDCPARRWLEKIAPVLGVPVAALCSKP